MSDSADRDSGLTLSSFSGPTGEGHRRGRPAWRPSIPAPRPPVQTPRPPDPGLPRRQRPVPPPPTRIRPTTTPSLPAPRRPQQTSALGWSRVLTGLLGGLALIVVFWPTPADARSSSGGGGYTSGGRGLALLITAAILVAVRAVIGL
jgi:hypothetical protein